MLVYFCSSERCICRSFSRAIEADPKTELSQPPGRLSLKATGEKNLLTFPVTKRQYD
jgi:hypothetical protein